MEKQQLQAVLAVDGAAPVDLPPIERALDLLATSREMPNGALAMCVARIEEAGPGLRAVLARAADGAALSEDEATLVFRGVYVLGAARDEKAWPLLRRLLHRPIGDIDHVLGDALTETMARIAAGVFDGDCDGLFEDIADRRLDEFVREQLLGAATFLTFEGRIDRETMRDFLLRFDRDRLAEDGEYVWVGWVEAIALLGFRDLAPLAERAFGDERLPERVLGLRHFEQDLIAAEQSPDERNRFEKNNLGYIDDVVEAIGWARWVEKDDDPDEEEGWRPSWTDYAPPGMSPALNPWRHVGRNDPCPCGSGKKAKKCCLAAA